MSYTQQVLSDHPVQVQVGPSGTTILVLDGDTVFYGDTNQTSSSLNQGSLSVGQSATITDSPLFIRSASVSDVSVQVGVVGTATQDVVVGSDGRVGGPGGTGLTASVVSGSSAGGVPTWASSTAYVLNQLVQYQGITYICLTTHTSGASFSGVGANWGVAAMTLSPGNALAQGAGVGHFQNSEPQWFGPWYTLGNAAGSNGGAKTPSSAPATTVGSGGVTLPLSNGTVPITDCAQISANGGSFTLGGFTIVYSGRSAASGAGNATGCWTLPTATGTYPSTTALGFVGIGWGPIAVYQKFGDFQGLSNEPVPGSTQAGYFIASYWGKTVDDAMEGVSGLAVAKDTGTPYTQTKNIIGVEGDGQIEGGNSCTSYVAGIGGRVSVLGTSHATAAYGVYSGLCAKDAGATIDTYYAFFQNASGGLGTTNYGLWCKDQILTQSQLTASDLLLTSAGAGVPDPLASAGGFLSWNIDPSLAQTGTAPTAGTIYASALPLQKGQVVQNLTFYINVAGSGTAPTSIFIGLCDATGKMLIQTANINGNAGWASTGIHNFTLSGSYTVPTSGWYYSVFLQVGAWGTTQMTLNRVTGSGTLPNGSLVQATGGTAQTGLPSNASSLVLAGTGSPLRYFVGAA